MPCSKSPDRVPRWEGWARGMLCVFGLILSVYALHVELSRENDPNYRAMCDLAESVSCSKVFTSRLPLGTCGYRPLQDSAFGRFSHHSGENWFNSLLVARTASVVGTWIWTCSAIRWKRQPSEPTQQCVGHHLYTLQLGVGQMVSTTAAHFLVMASWVSVAGSIYLACILVLVLGDFCMVCVSTYIINFALLYTNLKRRTGLGEIAEEDKLITLSLCLCVFLRLCSDCQSKSDFGKREQ